MTSAQRLEPPRVLIVPGWTNSGPEHWQTLWERADPQRFCRVEQRDWDEPRVDDWVNALDAAIAAEPAPPVLVAHSLGCIAIAHWAARFARPVAGALLVAPPDVERADMPEPVRNFAPVPLRPLPFRSILVASDNDEYITLDRAKAFARAWGSELVHAGRAGHINTDAGFGPWPEGERLLASLIP
ncbi:MAG TPA: alpha/beta hydrolase [Longimicrobium sp.]|nr:alpha/beta hydrolase [Longimicrobium sp.]